MDSALLPRNDSGDEDTISIVAYGETPPQSEAPNGNRNSWRNPPSNIDTSYQPPDWSSDDGAVVDGSARRIAVNSGTETNSSADSVSAPAPPLAGGNSFRSNSGAKPDPTASTRSPELATTPPANTTMRPLTLYGKDILHIIPFGSTALEANPVTWSDTLGAVDTEDDYSIRDPHFDLTNGKITKLLSLSNPDEKGMLSYEGFRCGLEAMGIACDSDRQFQAFVDVVDENKSGDISYEEFLRAIQEIKLAQLFNDPFIRTMPALQASLKLPVTLGSIEYSPDRIRCVCPINQVESFIYSTKPNWATVR
ncbi:hypothetical protein PF008_g26377 [Phytophthora fragariae]|nr:hypothetical protein PF008_g26377 [Phytophthora fragariae]